MSSGESDRPMRYVEDQLYEEHRKIREMMYHLEHAHGLGDLVRSLRDLRAMLQPHFLAEEATGGFFDLVSQRASSLDRIAKLREEHVALIREIECISESARACLAGPVADILKQAAALGQRIQRHEANESDLLGEVLNTDHGTGEVD